MRYIYRTYLLNPFHEVGVRTESLHWAKGCRGTLLALCQLLPNRTCCWLGAQCSGDLATVRPREVYVAQRYTYVRELSQAFCWRRAGATVQCIPIDLDLSVGALTLTNMGEIPLFLNGCLDIHPSCPLTTFFYHPHFAS